MPTEQDLQQLALQMISVWRPDASHYQLRALGEGRYLLELYVIGYNTHALYEWMICNWRKVMESYLRVWDPNVTIIVCVS